MRTLVHLLTQFLSVNATPGWLQMSDDYDLHRGAALMGAYHVCFKVGQDDLTRTRIACDMASRV